MSTQLSASNIFPEDYRGRLTEGITYDYRNNTLLWVDIILGEVHRISLDDLNKHEVLKWNEQGESIGFVALTKDLDTVLVCGKSGLAYGKFKANTLEYFFKYPLTEVEQKRLRSNDGIIDPWGNLWIGLMNDFHVTAKEGEVKPEGKLLRITPDLKVDVMIENTKISNGLAFCSKGTKLYWTDSLNYTIWKFDYDHETNTLSNKVPFLETKKVYTDVESPEPDGMVRTTNGEVYTAVFSTSTVLHVDKEGQVIEKIHVPAERCTCVTIGGQDGDHLFINTANLKLDDFDAKIDPTDFFGDLGGFLFKYKSDHNLKGIKKNFWGGDV
ncbi:rRNA-processing protein cgr1 [Lodderomyces elongisporus]|uniref:Cell growth protein CGR1 n=1 Tax=Lodderomyces elongisporus (strain ATCC 11503 / CBS 2605 / JCM 1781 / NBRC 1676 / NRRL YB-4239) TaxID=379508 RepID=A5E3J6_LODEL|nr:rRNA-processing protein cgr1 [Lodderomyces elongisporus]EDK46004.1 cell growth protein CGR1 [Lodderomyces elongisporus NRRL YB-4239]WLF80134.1 rRNA-processing protein cgr1 [Lodderomyces elongisporus]